MYLQVEPLYIIWEHDISPTMVDPRYIENNTKATPEMRMSQLGHFIPQSTAAFTGFLSPSLLIIVVLDQNFICNGLNSVCGPSSHGFLMDIFKYIFVLEDIHCIT